MGVMLPASTEAQAQSLVSGSVRAWLDAMGFEYDDLIVVRKPEDDLFLVGSYDWFDRTACFDTNP